MLKLHIEDVIGHIPVDKLDYRHLTYWMKTMQTKGRSAKTNKNNHDLIFSAMETAAVSDTGRIIRAGASSCRLAKRQRMRPGS